MKQESRKNYESLNPDSSAAKRTKKKFFTKGRIIALSIAVVIVGLCIWDITDPPVWWRFERQQDKKAIWEYVEVKYPDAKCTGSKFPFQKIAQIYPSSIMYFELNGINFHIAAEHGRVVEDMYPYERACAHFDKIIQEGFLKPMGIEAYTYYHFIDDYDVYPYTGSLVVCLTIRDQGSTPKEVGWLYDFYKYWKNEGSFLAGYRVEIRISLNDEITCHINYDNASEFANEDEFYSSFKAGR